MPVADPGCGKTQLDRKVAQRTFSKRLLKHSVVHDTGTRGPESGKIIARGGLALAFLHAWTLRGHSERPLARKRLERPSTSPAGFNLRASAQSTLRTGLASPPTGSEAGGRNWA